MSKLTRLQTAIIVLANERPDGALLPVPEALAATEKALSRALGGLVKKSLATSVGEDGDRGNYVLTDAGRAAVETADNDVSAAASAPAEWPARPGGKLGAVLKAVERKRGATLAELTETTGWQPHTSRAALTRLRQRGFPAALTEEGGRKAYRLRG